MEKRKLLLVAVSVGVFLVIVIGAAILVFTPRNAGVVQMTRAEHPIQAGASGTRDVSGAINGVPEDGAAESEPLGPDLPGGPGTGGSAISNGPLTPVERAQTPATVDPMNMVQKTPGLEKPLDAAPSIANNIYISPDNPNQPVLVERIGEGGKGVVINVPRPETVAVPNTSAPSPTPVNQAPKPPAAKAPVPKPVVTPVSSPPKTAPKTVESPAKAPAAPAPAAKAPAPAVGKSYDAFWIQTGSFSTRARADNAKESLAAKGITAIIENRDVEGKTYYRVRVGPYTAQTEADYWLKLVRSINGFEDSQVWKNQVQR